jgi:hypothetical protein
MLTFALFAQNNVYPNQRQLMSAIQLTTTNERFLISVNRDSIKQEVLLRLLERLRIEMLAEKVNFDESIEEVGEEIVANWWEQNKGQYLNPESGT